MRALDRRSSTRRRVRQDDDVRGRLARGSEAGQPGAGRARRGQWRGCTAAGQRGTERHGADRDGRVRGAAGQRFAGDAAAGRASRRGRSAGPASDARCSDCRDDGGAAGGRERSRAPSRGRRRSRQSGAQATPPPVARRAVRGGIGRGSSGQADRRRRPSARRSGSSRATSIRWSPTRAPSSTPRGPRRAPKRQRPRRSPRSPSADAKPLEDRYRDDGSVSVDDRKKYSLRSGGTSAALPTVGGVVPGERMSDEEMMGEIGGGKRTVIIIARGGRGAGRGRRDVPGVSRQAHRAKRGRADAGHRPDAADSAGASARAGPRCRRADAARPGRRRCGSRRCTCRRGRRAAGPQGSRSRSQEARGQKSQGQEAPLRTLAAREGAAPLPRAHPDATSAGGGSCLAHESPAGGARLRSTQSEQSVDDRCDGGGDLVDAPCGVEDDGAGSAGAELSVARGDAGLDVVGVVALVGRPAARRRAAATSTGRSRSSVRSGYAQLAREAGDPVALRLLGLVGQRREQVAIGDDVGACGQRRLDLARAGDRADRRRTAAPSPARRPARRAGDLWPPSRISRSRRPTGPVLGSRVACTRRPRPCR